MKKRRLLAALLAVIITLGFTACGGVQKTVTQVEIDPDAAYPLETEETLTVWMPIGLASARYQSGDEVPFFQELSKLTGVKFKFIHPPAGQTEQKLKIMLASGDVADIILYNWDNYPGGAAKAIEEGHIEPLNSLMETHAKDFKATLERFPNADKAAKTDDGDYYTFPQIKESESMNVAYGPVMRQDWLDDLGMEAPETLDEWYNVLKAFKEKKGAKVPLAVSYDDAKYAGLFFGAYGVAPDFYHDGDTVKYGPLEPGYKDALMYFKKLYDEGLIGDNITGQTSTELDSAMLNSESGATLSWLNSGVRAWSSNSAVKGTGFELAGIKYPSLNKGENAAWNYAADPIYPCFSISATSSKKQLAAKVLNFCYTEKGEMLSNYGIEGTTYEMVDGKPQYTDFVFNNPDGLSLSQVLGIYANCGAAGPYLYKEDAFKQINNEPVLMNAIEKWGISDTTEHRLPSSLSIIGDDLREYSNLFSDIDTYNSEMFYKFVMGQKSFDEYDDYVAQLKKMGAEKLVTIKQRAYDKYLSR